MFDTLLTVAREQPDGFRLLFEHAAREPQFAAFAEEVRAAAGRPGRPARRRDHPRPRFRPWVTRTIVGYLVDSVLAWLEVGDPALDEEFVERATDGLVALYLTWAPDAVRPC